MNGAEDEVRTRDPQLGRLMLYQLSYFRVFLRKPRVSWLRLGIETSFSALGLHKNSASPAYFKEKARCVGLLLWARMDSNHRRHRQQIYSLSHLTALVLALLFEPMKGVEPPTPRLQITCSGQLSYIGKKFISKNKFPQIGLQI